MYQNCTAVAGELLATGADPLVKDLRLNGNAELVPLQVARIKDSNAEHLPPQVRLQLQKSRLRRARRGKNSITGLNKKVDERIAWELPRSALLSSTPAKPLPARGGETQHPTQSTVSAAWGGLCLSIHPGLGLPPTLDTAARGGRVVVLKILLDNGATSPAITRACSHSR